MKGKGNSINYKYRMHDPRIGRFFAVDPLESKYPHYTPYQFSGNKVISHIELEGLEEAPSGSGSTGSEELVKEESSTSTSMRAGMLEGDVVYETITTTKQLMYNSTDHTFTFKVFKKISVDLYFAGTNTYISGAGNAEEVEVSSDTYDASTTQFDFNPYDLIAERKAEEQSNHEDWSQEEVALGLSKFKYQFMGSHYSAYGPRLRELSIYETGEYDGHPMTYLTPAYYMRRGAHQIEQGDNTGWVTLGLEFLPVMGRFRVFSNPVMKGVSFGKTSFSVMHSRSVAVGLSLRRHGSWALDLHTFGAGYGSFYKTIPSLHFHVGVSGQFAFRHHVGVYRFLKNAGKNFFNHSGQSTLDLLRSSKIPRQP